LLFIAIIGVGEGLSDLRDFDPELFVDSLLGYTPEQADALRGRYASNSVLQVSALLCNQPMHTLLVSCC
jgi:hypothetical protein